MTNEQNGPYTPYVRKTKTLEEKAVDWAKEHPIVVGVTTVLLVKNHNLKKRNVELRKQLRVASEAIRLASEFIVATGRKEMFEHYLGPRR